MKEKEITVTVTQVGHPLQKNVVSKTSTIGVYTKNKYFVFEDSPLSMLVRKGDVLHLSSSRDLLEIKNIEASFQETKSFHGRVERISQPFWYRTKETGLKDWYIILLAERNLIPIRAKNWNILLLRDGDEISLDLRQDKPLNFENKSLGFKFTSSLALVILSSFILFLAIQTRFDLAELMCVAQTIFIMLLGIKFIYNLGFRTL